VKKSFKIVRLNEAPNLI